MHNHTNPQIAVIGLGCHYPGANDVRTLWENILTRRQQFRVFPDQRLPLSAYHDADRSAPDKTYGARGAFIDGFAFDWAKRRIPKSVVESTDLVHWLALEVALQAIENAGYEVGTLPAERTCVFVGNTLTGEHTRSNAMRTRWPFVRRALEAAAGTRMTQEQMGELTVAMEQYYKSVLAPVTEDTLAGGLSNTIAGRICNFLNLNGGGYTVDGACSSSLLAIANAAAVIANGEMEVALAGGVDISLDTFEMIGFAKTGALTSGDMSVYDKKASGFIPGEGCGFVVLKDLAKARADGNTVYAVLRGWGISSDGKGGITAPKAEGQALALTRAYRRAGYAVHDLDFVEGHGTGTPVGDRTELHGIALAGAEMGALPPRSVGVTSFKSLVGHTKAAAGAGGFIKAVIAVNQRVIPPTVGCNEPHDIFSKEALGLYPVMEGDVRRKDDVLRAGVSAMGFGGINCHVTLESGDAPSSRLTSALDEHMLLASHQGSELFLIAGRTIPELIEAVARLQVRAQRMSCAELCDLAAETTRASADNPGAVRAAIVAESPDDLQSRLTTLTQALRQSPPAPGTHVQLSAGMIVANAVTAPRIGFLFPGQGSQQLNMTRQLVRRHQWARDLVDMADRCLVEKDFQPISPVLFKSLDRAFGTELADEWMSQLTDTRNAQVAICLASLIHAEYLRRLGVQPDAVAGHSLGELSALAMAGAMDARTLILLAAERGQAMAALQEDAGCMASLICSETQAEEIISQVPGYLTIACINSPSQIVLAGEKQAVKAAVEAGHARGIKARLLAVSNAFHSRLIAHAAQHLRSLTWLNRTARVSIPVVSAVDGNVFSGPLDLRDYCAAQVLAPVRFVEVAREIGKRCDLLIEVGPGRVLTALMSEMTGISTASCFPVESRPGADRDIHRLIGMLFTLGCDINMEVMYAGRLIRPFLPASERTFIDNPCERPFPGGLELPVASVPVAQLQSPGKLASMALPGISTQQLSTYLDQRSGFIAQVILADMDRSVCPQPAGLPAAVLQPAVVPPPSPPSPVLAPLPSSTPASAWACVQAVVAGVTGFAVDSLSPQLRLLDDLNLDSIKAGELLAEVSRRLQLAGQLDPLSLVNATLGEIAAALDALQPVSVPSQRQSAHGVISRTVARRTGFDADSLHAGLRLVDDLNLDSIKVGELIAEVGTELGVAGQVDPAVLANATLAEIAAAFEGAQGSVETRSQAQPATPAATWVAGEPWVRNFAIEWRNQSLPALSSVSVAFGAQSKILIFGEDGSAIAHDLGRHLSETGAKVVVAAYEHEQARMFIADASFTDCIFVLTSPVVAELEALVERLQLSALQPATLAANGQRRTLSYVLRGPQPGVHAFAASLHLERSGLAVRVITYPADIQAARIAGSVAEECMQQDAFIACKYDDSYQRWVMRTILQHPGDYGQRLVAWSAADVVIVTGGAKGITAECALALAQRHGVRMALVGSSRHSAERPDAAIAATLQRFRELGLEANYYACNITRQDAVDELVRLITRDMGMPTALIHGAGINKPRRVEAVTVRSALDEIAPKLLGAEYLLRACSGGSLKLVCALTSIIGVTGMAGNAWYGFSNEALDELVGRYQAAHPETAVLSIAYSVWAEVGMGARMGSTRHLEQIGISAIAPDEGVSRFLALWDRDPGVRQVVVAARLGGLDTWNNGVPVSAAPAIAASLRFVEEVVHLEPGIELVAQAHLHPDWDLYLRDHDYRGSLLLPTVFGLEAMAQVAALVLGDLRPFAAGRVIAIETIRLERPIVVADRGTVIQIHATVQERQVPGDPVRIRVAIRTEQTGWKVDHFTAELVLDSVEQGEGLTNVRQTSLPITPGQDLYGPLLFQGPRFQRIRGVRSLVAQSEFEGLAILDVEGMDGIDNQRESFSHLPDGCLLLGDPYLRDAILQSGQLLVPQHPCLPIAIDRIVLKLRDTTSGNHQLMTRLLGCIERDISADCVLADAEGQFVEKLEGYRARILETERENPTVADLCNLGQWEEDRLRTRLDQAARMVDVSLPELSFAWALGLHALRRPARRKREMPLVRQAWQRRFPDQPMPELQWLESGKPVFSSGTAGVSISHDNMTCLVIVGADPVGCDLAPVSARSRQEWLALLSNRRELLLDQLVDSGDTLDLAGTRIWATLEALIKAHPTRDMALRIAGRSGETVILTGHTSAGSMTVLSLPFVSWRGTRQVVAITCGTAAMPSMLIQEEESPVAERLYGIFKPSSWVTRGAENVLHFHHRFHLTMDDICSIGRTVPFSRYYTWMGRVRELSMEPVMTEMTEAIASGEWGAVTTYSEVRVLGEARRHDTIVGVVHAQRLPDSDESMMDLRFNWYKELPDGSLEHVASSAMRIVWVKMLGHGIVEKHKLPVFLYRFLEEMGKELQNDTVLPGGGLSALARGQRLVTYVNKYGAAPILHREQFQTDPEDSDLLGNIYHSHYGKWQGRVRDRYLHQLAPQHFRRNSADGIWICQRTRINYLREAMPFDTIEVTMYLRELYQHAVGFSFTYYRVAPDNSRTKLAHGEQDMIWVQPATDGVQHPAEIPDAWRLALIQRVSGDALVDSNAKDFA